jgi:hypothetical protein
MLELDCRVGFRLLAMTAGADVIASVSEAIQGFGGRVLGRQVDVGAGFPRRLTPPRNDGRRAVAVIASGSEAILR